MVFFPIEIAMAIWGYATIEMAIRLPLSKWMWYQHVSTVLAGTHLFELGLRLALPARLQASWRHVMWRLRWATQRDNPYLRWKKWKNDLRMEAFLLTCRISGGIEE